MGGIHDLQYQYPNIFPQDAVNLQDKPKVTDIYVLCHMKKEP